MLCLHEYFLLFIGEEMSQISLWRHSSSVLQQFVVKVTVYSFPCFELEVRGKSFFHERFNYSRKINWLLWQWQSNIPYSKMKEGGESNEFKVWVINTLNGQSLMILFNYCKIMNKWSRHCRTIYEYIPYLIVSKIMYRDKKTPRFN